MAYWPRLAIALGGLAVYGWALTQPGAMGAGGEGEAFTGIHVATLGALQLLLYNPAGLAWVGIPAYIMALVIFLFRVDRVAAGLGLVALLLPLAGGFLARFVAFPVDASGTNYTTAGPLLWAFWLSLLGPGSILAGALIALRMPHREPGEGEVAEGPIGRYRYVVPYALAYLLAVVGLVGSGLFLSGWSGFMAGFLGMLALHGAATVILLVFVYRLWLHLPLQHRPYTPGFVTALMAIPLVNLAWHFVALPGWVRRYQAFRREQGGTVHPRLLPLGYWTGALWAATWVPFLAVLAGPAAVVTQLVFINAAAREVNGETAVAGDQPQPEVAGA